MSHLTESELNATLDGALEGRELDRIESHLAGCDQCHSALAALEAGDRALARALDHDPGDEYFATFADRVEERLRGEGLAGAFAPPRARKTGWFPRPSGLALAGATAATLVGAGLVFIIAREVESPSLRRSDVTRHLESSAPSAPESAALPSTKESKTAGDEAALKTKGATTSEVDRAKDQTTASGQTSGATNSLLSTPMRAPTNSIQAARQRAELEALQQAQRDEAQKLRESARPAQPLAIAPPTAARDLEAARRQAADRLTRSDAVARDAREPARTTPSPSPSAGFAPAPGSIASGTAPPSALAPGAMTPLASRAAPPLPQPHGALAPAPSTPLAKNEAERSNAPATNGAAASPEEGRAKKAMVLDEQADAGTGELCGRVLDLAGHGIASAAVTIAETGASSHTDASGRFCIRATAGDRTVLVMAVGYEEVRRPVLVAERNPEMAVVMRTVDVLGARSAAPPAGSGGSLGFMQRGGDSATRPSPAGSSTLGGLPLGRTAGPTGGAELKVAPLADLELGMLTREAQRATAEATREPTATRYDAAAAAWERVVPHVEGKPSEVDTRFRVARFRYLAWEADPTRSRSVTAHAALTAYVLRAPMGAEREQATRWLERVKP